MPAPTPTSPLERRRPADLLLLAATTGMRRGELLGLRWCELDLPNRRLSIVQTLIAPCYRVQVSTPKTDSGTRAIALDAGTIAALELSELFRGFPTHRRPVDRALVFLTIALTVSS